jgi:lipopolysaccharide export system protein LptC
MFRFTIRELVLLTLIVAMGVGWWLDHQRQASEIQKLKNPWPGYQFDTF